MPLEICAHSDQDKLTIWNLFQFYCYDTSNYDGYDVESNGLYSMSESYFSQYWTEPVWRAHVLRVDGAIAGFALIEPSDAVSGGMEIADLFIMSRFRRRGIAKEVVLHFMTRRVVPWTVVVYDDAADAKAFWSAMFLDPAITPTSTAADPDGRQVTVYVLEKNLP
nr:GNAT family N-acetyltransferase [uncultured Undibacterium sp.]